MACANCNHAESVHARITSTTDSCAVSNCACDEYIEMDFSDANEDEN